MTRNTAPSTRPEPGAWLTRQMDDRGISVQQLATAMGVTEKSVYDWRGNRTPISESRIAKLAEILSVSEIEARRGLGYWVPNGEQQESGPAIDRAELVKLKQDLLSILERIDKLGS